MATCIQCSNQFSKSAYLSESICSRKCKGEHSKAVHSITTECPSCGVAFTYDDRKPRVVCSVACQHAYQKTPAAVEVSRRKVKDTLIKKYGVDHNSKVNGFSDKRQKTNLMKYGVTHYTNREKARETRLTRYGNINYSNTAKTKETMLKKYGVSAFSQSPLFKQRLLEKYGVDHPLHTPENKKRMYKKVISRLSDITPKFKEDEYDGVHGKAYNFECNTCKTEFESSLDDGRIPICRVCHPMDKTKSKCEYEIIDWIKTFYDGTIIHGDKSILTGKELDIYLPDLSIAIELNGLYYHGENTGKKNKKYHLAKTNQCARLGITLLHILDIEWIRKREIVKSILVNKIKPSMTTKIHGRECTITEISPAESNVFLNDNHIQGEDTSSVRIGLVYKGELVSLLTFGKNRFSKQTDWEMYRFCSKIGCTVRGGLEKLFNYFKENYDPASILTFSDRRYFTGDVYSRIEFTLVAITPPNYHYFKVNRHDTVFSSRNRFQKHKLKNLLEKYDDGLTEWGNMQINGYDRIWDCGNMKWVWYK